MKCPCGREAFIGIKTTEGTFWFCSTEHWLEWREGGHIA